MRTPTIENLTVKRRYLTEREVERLMDCARKYGPTGIATRPRSWSPIATVCGPRRSATCNGGRSSYPRGACTFTGSRTAFPAYIRSAATKCERCVSYADYPTRTFGEADLSLGHLGAAASGRRQARDGFRLHLYRLGI